MFQLQIHRFVSMFIACGINKGFLHNQLLHPIDRRGKVRFVPHVQNKLKHSFLPHVVVGQHHSFHDDRICRFGRIGTRYRHLIKNVPANSVRVFHSNISDQGKEYVLQNFITASNAGLLCIWASSAFSIGNCTIFSSFLFSLLFRWFLVILWFCFRFWQILQFLGGSWCSSFTISLSLHCWCWNRDSFLFWWGFFVRFWLFYWLMSLSKHGVKLQKIYIFHAWNIHIPIIQHK